MKIQRLFLLSMMALILTINGCNTFKGMGKDIEGAGQALGKASDKTREAISK